MSFSEKESSGTFYVLANYIISFASLAWPDLVLGGSEGVILGTLMALCATVLAAWTV